LRRYSTVTPNETLAMPMPDVSSEVGRCRLTPD
jgi:hypothetical protein